MHALTAKPAHGHRKRKRTPSPTFELKEEPNLKHFAASGHESNEDEMTDDDDDNDAMVEVAWQESQEQFPPYPIYHLNLPGLLACLTTITRAVSEILQTDASDNPVLQSLNSRVMDIEVISESKALKIALLGDAGTGRRVQNIYM